MEGARQTSFVGERNSKHTRNSIIRHTIHSSKQVEFFTPNEFRINNLIKKQDRHKFDERVEKKKRIRPVTCTSNSKTFKLKMLSGELPIVQAQPSVS